MKIEAFSNEDGEWTIIIGKNREENWKIIDESDPTDIWFHVHNIPSCHVILKSCTNLSSVSNDVLKHCGLLCKMNSKAKTEKKTIIMYSPIINVKKTKTVGEVIVNSFKTLVV
jgi:predicted ribosome quality control (RQC) complex YloA/Tae2 family protein